MSMISGLIDNVKSTVENIQSYCRLVSSYLQKNRPVEATVASWMVYVKNLMTASKKIRIAKYRVTHLRYRLNQMEKLIATNNPESYSSGRVINLMR